MAKSNTNRICLLCKNEYQLIYFKKARVNNSGLQSKNHRYVCQWCTETSYKKVKKNAEDRNIDFFLSEDEFEQVRRNPCYYCGYGNVSGIDRGDSLIGYELSNVLPCCKTCNYLKGRQQVGAFITKCKQIAAKHSS